MVNFTFNRKVSPVIVTANPPDKESMVQELYDAVKNWADEPINLKQRSIISGAGKEDLGGGTKVGLTITLLNAKQSFGQRVTSESEGTITTADSNGEKLIDSAATFESDGVSPGDAIINFTDRSVGTVLEVISETEIEHMPLEDGSDNQWEIGDAYKIWPVEQCEVSGGNLVAVDGNGDPMSPIFPTPFTQVILARSSSATIQDQQLQEATQYIVESQRRSHTGTGEIFFWDPISGDDNFNGLLPSRAKKTWAGVEALVVSGRHDIIFIVGTSGGSSDIIITEQISITKDWLFLRGPGRNVVFRPVDDSADTIAVNAYGVELDSFCVETFGSGTPRRGIFIAGTSEFIKISNIWCELSTLHGIEIAGGDYHKIQKCRVHGSAGDGIRATDVDELVIEDCDLHENIGWGAQLISSGPGNCKDVEISGGGIHDNISGDVKIGLDVSETMLRANVYIEGTIEDNGTNTHDEAVDSRTNTVNAVWSSLPAKILLGLAGMNQRIFPTNFDTFGNMTTGYIRIYNSKDDADANQNHIAQVDLTGTFIGINKPDEQGLKQVLTP